MTDRYFVRPHQPDAIRWTHCPEEAAQELLDRGWTEVDKDAWRVHMETWAQTRHPTHNM